MVIGKKYKYYINLILAMAKKDYLINSKYPLSTFMSLFDVLISYLLISLTAFFIGKSFGHHSSFSASMNAFLLSGLIIYQFFDVAMNGLVYGVIVEKNLGTLNRNFASPAPKVLLLFGIVVYSFILALIRIAILLIAAKYLFGIGFFVSWQTFVFGGIVALCVMIISSGYGFLGAGITVSTEDPALYLFLMQRPFVIFTGVFYSIMVLPIFLKLISYMIPITYGIDLFRHFTLEHATFVPWKIEVLIIGLSVVFFPLIGILAFKKIEKSFLKKGTLNMFE